MNDIHHYLVMGIIMVVSGLLSSMNVWVDSIEHIRISLNDIYMAGLMTGWMFLFMGLIYRQFIGILLGLPFIILSFLAIRTQAFVSQEQFIRGMIPHHSMAIHMSKRLLQKPTTLQGFLQGIITAQSKEITFMRQV